MTAGAVPGAPVPGAPAPVAVVLHGLTGTPRSVEPVAEALAAAGYDVEMPTLAGHDATPEALAATGWDDWVASAEAAHDRARARGAPVALVGISMGGTLACHLAARRGAAPAALVVINPFVDPPAESFRDMLGEMLAQGVEVIGSIGGDTAKADAVDESANQGLPVACLLSLSEALVDLAGRLAAITCPTLILTSAVDHVVPPVSSDVLAASVSGSVRRVTLADSYHMATLDHDGPRVVAETLDFLAQALQQRETTPGF